MEPARDSQGRLLVVADTCIVVNFILAGRLDLLEHHADYHFVVTEHTREETRVPAELQELEAAIAAGDLEEIQVDDPEELAIFATLNAVVGRGEAAAIAVAEKRGWVVATDEKKRTRREVEARLGKERLLTTPGVLLKAILNGAISLAEADGIKAKLEQHRFVMDFASFADLVALDGPPHQ